MIEADLQADAARNGARTPKSFARALRDPKVYGLAVVYFAFYALQSVLLLWVPTLLKSVGTTDLTEIGWRAGGISLVGTLGMVAIGYSSDVWQERRWHLIGCGAIAAGLFLALPLGSQSPNVTTLLLAGAAAVLFGFLGLFWTVPSTILDRGAAAGGIALISSIGAPGAALSPTFIGWMKVLTGSFYGAVGTLAMVMLAAMVIVYFCVPSRTAASGAASPGSLALTPENA